MVMPRTGPMAIDIDCYETIASLQKINGLSIEEIEERARPGQYAQSGFIGPTEHFKDVLQQDWNTVQALGLTHIALANHLWKIWNHLAHRDGSRHFSYGKQKLVGKVNGYRGLQEDIFQNNENRFDGAWSHELTLTNLSNNVSIRVGQGVIAYIAKYGFYEGGGDRNPYRIDPLKVIAVLTGKPLSLLRSKVV